MKDETDDKSYESAVRGRRVAAVVLLLVAGAAIFGHQLPFSWRDGMLLLLGVGFIAWAAIGRVSGLLVPGGILTGIGCGIMLREEYGNAAFLISMAGGFLLISILYLLIFGRKGSCWWPVYPAAGLAFAGLTQIAGPNMREWIRAGQPYWPYALIGVALFLLLSKPAKKD